MFDELLEVVSRAIVESGTVDISTFKKSEEYEYIHALFKESFLGNQLIIGDDMT